MPSTIAPDQAYQQGAQAANQQSYLQQILANTKASQDNEARIKQQQNQMIVDPSVFKHGAGAQMASGATPDGKLIYSSPAHFTQAREQDEAKYAEKTGLDTNEAVANNALKSGLVDSKHPAYGAVMLAAGRKPLPTLQQKQLEELGQMAGEQSLGAMSVDKYGKPLNKANIPDLTGGGGSGTPPPGYRREIDTNQWGLQSLKDIPPTEQRAMAEGALRDKGWTSDMPGYAAALYTATQRLTPYMPGGGAIGRDEVIPLPPGAPQPSATPAPGAGAGGSLASVGKQLLAAADQEPDAARKALYVDLAKRLATAPQAPAAAPAPNTAGVSGTPAPGPQAQQGVTPTGRGGFTSPPVRPDAQTTKNVLETDQAITNLGELARLAGTDEIKNVSGTLWTNPTGALKQAGSALPAMIRPSGEWGLTPAQSSYNAQLSQTITSIRKALFGVRVTAPELATLAPAVPEGPTDPYLIPKLQSWQKFMQEHRDDINNAMSYSNHMQIPQRQPSPGAAPAPGGAQQPPTKRWTRDASGKLVPVTE